MVSLSVSSHGKLFRPCWPHQPGIANTQAQGSHKSESSDDKVTGPTHVCYR